MNNNQSTHAEGQEDLFPDRISSLSAVQMAIHQKELIKARNILFYIACLILVATGSSISVSYTGIDTGVVVTAGVGVLISGIFIGLGLWIRSKPYTALIISILVVIIFFVAGIFFYTRDLAAKNMLTFLISISLFPII